MKKSCLLFILILSAFLAFSCSDNDDEELVNTGWEGPHQDDNGTDTLPEAVTDDEDKTDTTSTSDDDETDTVSEYDDSDDNSDDIDISDIDISENDDDVVIPNDDDDTSDIDSSENDSDSTDTTDDDTDSGDSQPDDDGDTSSPEQPAFPQCSPTSSKPCILGRLIWSETKKTNRTQGGCNTDCNNLEEAGYSTGWRLPTINELRTLVQNCSKTVSLPEGECKVSDTCIDPSSCKDEDNCKCSSGNDYSKLGDTDSLWSGTKVDSSMSAAWYINFSNAYIDSTNTSEKKSARCVHEIK